MPDLPPQLVRLRVVATAEQACAGLRIGLDPRCMHEELGEGIQLQFYADAIARITTARPGEAGADPQYQVEYSLVDGMGGYRHLVSAFVQGGCAALDTHGPWMSDVAEFKRARRR